MLGAKYATLERPRLEIIKIYKSKSHVPIFFQTHCTWLRSIDYHARKCFISSNFISFQTRLQYQGHQNQTSWARPITLTLVFDETKMGVCSVKGCSGQDHAMHCFPKTNALKLKWEEQLNRPNFTASESSRVCEKHFSEDSFVPARLNVNKRGEQL